eukprot:CAMPEP_0176230760 /NCGR_PEP_ID=MMETSP0121_2-20121125/24459_1 /TAXON_ID=160619 /ORGANISM="Kryptoperidinium foliaceum, Strain CCMP 1326" /LENGTH=51 /DNA_ID=CAMNT_0017570101 /DNA_START=46 /DNA_END=201 /DNA_ORIENTATION=-
MSFNNVITLLTGRFFAAATSKVKDETVPTAAAGKASKPSKTLREAISFGGG